MLHFKKWIFLVVTSVGAGRRQPVAHRRIHLQFLKTQFLSLSHKQFRPYRPDIWFAFGREATFLITIFSLMLFSSSSSSSIYLSLFIFPSPLSVSPVLPSLSSSAALSFFSLLLLFTLSSLPSLPLSPFLSSPFSSVHPFFPSPFFSLFIYSPLFSSLLSSVALFLFSLFICSSFSPSLPSAVPSSLFSLSSSPLSSLPSRLLSSFSFLLLLFLFPFYIPVYFFCTTLFSPSSCNSFYFPASSLLPLLIFSYSASPSFSMPPFLFPLSSWSPLSHFPFCTKENGSAVWRVGEKI